MYRRERSDSVARRETAGFAKDSQELDPNQLEGRGPRTIPRGVAQSRS